MEGKPKFQEQGPQKREKIIAEIRTLHKDSIRIEELSDEQINIWNHAKYQHMPMRQRYDNWTPEDKERLAYIEGEKNKFNEKVAGTLKAVIDLMLLEKDVSGWNKEPIHAAEGSFADRNYRKYKTEIGDGYDLQIFRSVWPYGGGPHDHGNEELGDIVSYNISLQGKKEFVTTSSGLFKKEKKEEVDFPPTSYGFEVEKSPNKEEFVYPTLPNSNLNKFLSKEELDEMFHKIIPLTESIRERLG